MEKIFILGATKYAFMLRKMIVQEKQYHVIGHTVSKKHIEIQRVCCEKEGIQIYPLEELKEYVCDNDKVNILNAIGYSDMNRIRMQLFKSCMDLGYNVVNYISNRAIVLSDEFGKGNIVFPGAYIGTGVKVGSNNVFYAGSVMTHDIQIGNHNFFAANITCGGEVNIGSNCFIGMGAVIRNRLRVSDYSLIGASAYLDFSTKEQAVVVPTKSVELNKSSLDVSLTPKER